MRWSLTLLVLVPLVASLHACRGDENGHVPTILQHQPDVPSIDDREYRNRNPLESTGGSSASGGAASGTGGTDIMGGQGGAPFGGQGGLGGRGSVW